MKTPKQKARQLIKDFGSVYTSPYKKFLSEKKKLAMLCADEIFRAIDESCKGNGRKKALDYYGEVIDHLYTKKKNKIQKSPKV